MCQYLSPYEQEKVRELKEIRQKNNDFAWMLCDYLNNTPRLITKELMESVNPDNILPEETVYGVLLSGFCGLNTENNERDRQFADDYFRVALKKLNPKQYALNPFYQNIVIPEVQFGHWALKYQKYMPYEAFIYKDYVLEPNFKEIPNIGFFDEEFKYPVVLENGHEWMAIKPSEIETSQTAIDSVTGNVITFGLGLGYFAYMASIKDRVKSITVIEHDNQVIQLFKQYILPQFRHKEKVTIIAADAFEYTEKIMPQKNFDFAFVDTWHDVSDGLGMYFRMKKLERYNPNTKFLYWIEDSILSNFRWQIFDWVVNHVKSYGEIIEYLSMQSLKKLAALETKFQIVNY
ncbi:MAG: hypothetical protein AB7S48_09685 [Bacteroidales bacterium]